MFIMTSKILKFAYSWKTQKSKYLENTIFSPSKKIHQFYINGHIMVT